MNATFDRAVYGRLLSQAVPGVIKTKRDHKNALATVERIMSKGERNLSPEEGRLLELLVVLIEKYEDAVYPISKRTDPRIALRELMSEHGLKQTDLVDVFGTQSVVSEVLNGKRQVSKAHARNLADRFRLPVDIFI